MGPYIIILYIKWILILSEDECKFSSAYQERFKFRALVELIALLIPGILFVQLMILRESTFPKPVHLLMLNLLVANITVGLGGVILNTGH